MMKAESTSKHAKQGKARLHPAALYQTSSMKLLSYLFLLLTIVANAKVRHGHVEDNYPAQTLIQPPEDTNHLQYYNEQYVDRRLGSKAGNGSVKSSKSSDKPKKKDKKKNKPSSNKKKPNKKKEKKKKRPTKLPTRRPTGSPSKRPAGTPTKIPTQKPTLSPSKRPTGTPTKIPTQKPTISPSKRPTGTPTKQPTQKPTISPSNGPTDTPTKQPTQKPTISPSKRPTGTPTKQPTQKPTISPSKRPTGAPSKQPTQGPTVTPITGQIDEPIYAFSSDPLIVVLPQSTTGTLLTLSQVKNDTEYNIPVSRSYDGFEWETLHPLLLPVECAASCNVRIPSYSGNISMYYIIEEFNPPARTKEQTFAKLLLQGTYGPTQESLQEAIDLGSAAAWVRDQMDMKPTLLREHYRRRTNGYLKTDLHHHALRLACEPGSRWNRHAFNRWRDVGKTIKEVVTGTGSYYLKIDGIARTEVAAAPSAEFGLNTSYVICREDPNTRAYMSDFYYHEPTGQKGRLLVAADSESCSNPTAIDMPQVAFTNAKDAFGKAIPSVNLVSIEGDPNVFEAKLLQSINPSFSCDDFKKTWPNFVEDASTGLYYVEDRRFELYDNTDGSTTVKKRLLDGRCPRTPRTFLNEDTCFPRTDCSPPVYSGEVTLNAENLRQFYEIDGRYLYRIQGLPLLDTPSPCDTKNNRFVRKNAGQDSSGCVNGTANFPSIRIAIEDALLNVTFDALVIDIKETDLNCDDPNDDALGASFTVTLNNGTLSCWTHTYPHEWSVFVANDWVSNHPGNAKYFRDSKANPIAYPAEHENASDNVEESIALNFPPWGFHEYNWHDNRGRFESDIVGLFGDRIAFNTFPSSAKSDAVILALGGSIVADSSAVIEVCGSKGEVANDPSLGHQYLLQKYDDTGEEDPRSLDQDHDRWVANNLVFNTVSVNAKDQLRHRVAWALSSIFVVTESQIAREGVEPWAVYYDIFLRNAFGNFFDILKEVTFSPIMAEMLTYKGSKSFSYQAEKTGAKLYPDENFAREIMQLFTIGLYMLNPDGTKIVDKASGQPVPTYSNKDVMNFARAFTNFEHQGEERDNIEVEWRPILVRNAIDPMYFPASEGRDFFPKQTLAVNGEIGYIGDRVQQCETLTKSRAWLRKGAVYHFRENSQSLLGKKDPAWWSEKDDWSPRLVLDPSSSNLFQKLCNWNDSIKTCDFNSTVILDEDLECDGSCIANQTGNPGPGCECSIEMPRTVRLDFSPTSAPVWFEYVMEPCIQMAFVPPENVNAVREIGAGKYGNKAMCANNQLPVAGNVCCDAEGKNPQSICLFRGERTTYATAQDRCSAYKPGYKTCAWDKAPISLQCGTDVEYNPFIPDSSKGLRFSWTSEPCSVGVQIDVDGNIAIVHSVGSIAVKERVGIDTGTYSGVIWKDGLYPSSEANCGGVCQVHGNTCLCNDVAVKTNAVFSQLPTPQDLDKLHIGASDPHLSTDGKYYLCTAPLCSEKGYKVYFFSLNVSEDTDIPGAMNEETVFELTESGSTIFLLNMDSTVEIGTSYSFRNPPMYNSPVDPTQRDGLYETDAVLQHLVNHPNTAPFISTKLINFFITSNPSPRYVQIVSDAFSKGVYVADGQSFGSGRYGDMEALVAAMMLDRESTSTTLDDDSNHGRARESLIEIIHLSRSMKLSTESGTPREIGINYLKKKGLQESFNAPTVFSFFVSEYQPVGPVLTKGLRAPEAQLFDAPKLIKYVNSLFSLTQYGLNDCELNNGLGSRAERYYIGDYPDGGVFSCPQARNDPGVPLRLRYTPLSWGGSFNAKNASASAIVGDIDLLLTGGRISGENKAIMEAVYDSVREVSSSDEDALHAVIEHFVAAPEFHITNNLFSSKAGAPSPRPLPDTDAPQDPKPVTDYKAIIYLFLSGAMDSFSALVPLNCELHNQYLEVRGDVAISSGLRQIDASGSNQPCDTFGLHPSLVNIHQLFQERDASFFANIGPLVETMDKYEYRAKSKPRPPALFAHNTQTQITQTVFAQDSSAGGVLGRIGDALNLQEGKEIFDAYSISGTPKILEGAPGVSKAADVLSGAGVSSFSNEAASYEDNIEALSKNKASSIYGETFSSAMTSAIYRTRLLDGVVGDITLENDSCFTALNTDIALQYRQVARIIKSRDGLESKRDVFYTQDRGYDTHDDATATLIIRLKEVDDAIGCFVKEMKSQGIWSNVTIASASEFGRTLTSNGMGTDHAWGANHWIAGGTVKGGKIHGQYPDDLTEDGILNIGRGRLIPTTPWEGMWAGLAEWFGVTSQNIVSTVLPNIGNFQTNIFGETDLFDSTNLFT